jgi:hypothetical protein
LPEHHKIYDKDSAKRSSLESIPEIAGSSGLRSAAIMKKSGADVYQDKIDIIGGNPDTRNPADLDLEVCRRALNALAMEPRSLVSCFIGINKQFI